MRRVQRVGVRLSVTPMVIRVALSATAGESEKCEIDGSAYMALRDIVNYYSERAYVYCGMSGAFSCRTRLKTNVSL